MIRKLSSSALEKANPDMKPGSLRSISWDDVGTQVSIPSWRTFVAEYSTFLTGLTAASVPDQITNLRKIGDGMRDPKGMLLGPEQRKHRAGHLLAAAVALALVDHGWVLNVGPGFFGVRNSEASLNPFLGSRGIDQRQTVRARLDRSLPVSRYREPASRSDI